MCIARKRSLRVKKQYCSLCSPDVSHNLKYRPKSSLFWASVVTVWPGVGWIGQLPARYESLDCKQVLVKPCGTRFCALSRALHRVRAKPAHQANQSPSNSWGQPALLVDGMRLVLASSFHVRSSSMMFGEGQALAGLSYVVVFVVLRPGLPILLEGKPSPLLAVGQDHTESQWFSIRSWIAGSTRQLFNLHRMFWIEACLVGCRTCSTSSTP